MERYKPLISVIVPVYNDELFLHRCLDSILNQTYDVLEILLIDDGSTDASGQICDEYQLKDDRIKAIHKLNEGTVSARKCGLKYAHGELVSFIDGDDWIDSDMYETLMDVYFQADCPDMISSGLIYEYPEYGEQRVLLDGAENGRYDKHDIEQELLPVLIYNPLTGHNTILTSVCTKLIYKEAAQKAMDYMRYSLTLGEDGAYVYFLACCCSSLVVIKKAFYHYEQHKDSQNNKFTLDAFKRLIELKEVMIEGMGGLGWKKYIYIKEQINYYVWNYLSRTIEEQFHLGIGRFLYLFPFARCSKGSTLLLYGAGVVGRSYVKCLESGMYAEKIIWADKNYKELRDSGLDVVSVDEALQQYYDYIVIAIEDEAVARLIIEKFLMQGITEEKIIWEKPVRILPYVNDIGE